MRERRERNGVTVLDDAAFAGYRFTAEILDDGKPGGEIEGKDFGRGETLLAQPLADRDERPYILSELGDGAIGFAIAKRRSVRAGR